MTTSSRLVLVALALALQGCVSIEMGRAQREMAAQIEQTSDATVGRGFAVAFGRGTLGSSRFLARLFAPKSTEPFRRITGNVRQIKVARAPIDGPFDATVLRRPSFLDRYDDDDGWLRLVTVRDSSEAVWVMTRERSDGTISDLVAVTVGDEEMLITRLRGDLSSLVLDAIDVAGEFDDGDFLDSVFEAPADDDPAADARP